MSGSGSPGDIAPDFTGRRVVVVAASWHATVMAGLVAGAMRVAQASGATVELLRVPGTFELPVAALAAARAGADAIVALGVVIRGGTPHFEYVCDAATQGLTRVALDTGVPVGFGVLTCDNEEQALARAGLADSHEDKGAQAAAAAITTAAALARLTRN